jgi:16S rRNA (uracil1498-N3)-methyltransferase
MARFYAPPDQWSGNTVSLDTAEARHAVEVLRFKAGDKVDVFDGCGRRAKAVLKAASKRAADLELHSVQTQPRTPFAVTLVQSVPKGQLMEWIIEKSVELGATCILPILSARTVVRLDTAERVRKREKWFRVAVEACKQCGQDWIPEVCIPQDIAQVLASEPGVHEITVIGSLGKNVRPMQAVLKENPSDSIRLVVGPEGDFSEVELQAFVERGAFEASLGALTLRSETAALYMLSVVSFMKSGAVNLVS